MNTIVGNNQCPSPNVWADFLRGKVSDESLHQLSSHLLTCPDCLAVLDGEDGLVSIPTRQANLSSPYLGEDGYFRLLGWIENLSSIGIDDRPTEPVQAPLPTQIGRFQIKGVLGVGAFGRVYEADDPLLKRSVAIKAPLRNRFGTDSDLASFLNEARHAAALDREGIVPIYDVIVDESGRTLIVMKHIRGQSLAEVRRAEAIGLRRAVQLMIKIAEAVHFAHERGFVHRDLKPANILIDENDRPWVTDFGLGLSLTASNSPFESHGGTPQYMSPEQVRLDIPATNHRSDIWALGVMLAELVHGCKPFPQRERKELFQAITTAEPAIASSRETIELDEIIRRCLAKRPEDRFATAKVLADRLSKWSSRHFPSGLAKWKYGWRRAVVGTAALLAIVGTVAQVRVNARARATKSTVEALAAAPLNRIAKLVADLNSQKVSHTELSRIAAPSDDEEVFRFDLASFGLQHRNPNTIPFDHVIGHTLTSSIDRLAAIVDTIKLFVDQHQRNPALIDVVVQRLVEELSGNDQQASLRLSACLAAIDPSHPALRAQLDNMAMAMSSKPDNELTAWLTLFEPLGKNLAESPLRQIMNSTDCSERQQINALKGLCYYANATDSDISSLVLDCDDFELPLITEHLSCNKIVFGGKLHDLYDSLAIEAAAEGQSLRAPKRTEIKQAKCAIVLALMGDLQAANQAFQANVNPTLRTLVIHGLTKQALPWSALIQELAALESKHDPFSNNAKFGLLHILALSPAEECAARLPTSLLRTMVSDSDPGVHSSAAYLAQQLSIDLGPVSPGAQAGWFVENVADAPVEFVIVEPGTCRLGAPRGSEKQLLTAPWPEHDRAFAHRIAITAKEITIEQFRRILPGAAANNKSVNGASLDCAMTHISLNEAREYCNQISQLAGFDVCYVPSTEGHLIARENIQALTGYRLPTDAEWERVCRAGSATDRFFGNLEDLLVNYAWTKENEQKAKNLANSILLSQPVGSRLCNRWGLFDTYGNALEICDRSLDPEEATSPDSPSDDRVTDDFRTSLGLSPILRGSSNQLEGKRFAISYMRTYQILGGVGTGLRIVRTLSQ